MPLPFPLPRLSCSSLAGPAQEEEESGSAQALHLDPGRRRASCHPYKALNLPKGPVSGTPKHSRLRGGPNRALGSERPSPAPVCSEGRAVAGAAAAAAARLWAQTRADARSALAAACSPPGLGGRVAPSQQEQLCRLLPACPWAGRASCTKRFVAALSESSSSAAACLPASQEGAALFLLPPST